MSYGELDRNRIAESSVDAERCRALWCAVIEAQWHTAFAVQSACKAHEVDAARRWFGTRDFYMVCALAGVDGRLVRKGFRQRLAEPQVAA